LKRARFLTVDFYILLVLKWSSKICIEKYYSENKITLHTVRTPKRPLIVTFPTVLNVSKKKNFFKFSKTNKNWQILKNKTSVAETLSYFKNLFQIFQLVFVKMSFVEISTKKVFVSNEKSKQDVTKKDHVIFTYRKSLQFYFSKVFISKSSA
jgi:hypothetical protein